MQIERRDRLKKFDFDEILTHRDKFIPSLLTSRRVCFFNAILFYPRDQLSIRSMSTFISSLFETCASTSVKIKRHSATVVGGIDAF